MGWGGGEALKWSKGWRWIGGDWNKNIYLPIEVEYRLRWSGSIEVTQRIEVEWRD